MPIPKDQRPQYDNVFLLLFWVYQTLFLGKTTNQMDCPYVLFITLADIDLHIRFWMLRIHHTEYDFEVLHINSFFRKKIKR